MLTHDEEARLKRMVTAMRERNGPVTAVAACKLESVTYSIARELADGFSEAEVAAKFRDIVSRYPSVMEASEPTPQQRAADEAREPDPKSMSAPDRLAFANAQKLAEMEKAAATDAKLGSVDHAHDALRSLSPMARLALVREMKALGVDEPKSPKPITREQLARMTAERRLSHANEQAMKKENDK